MFTRAELKDKAKQQISGNIGMLFVINLIAFLILGASSMIPMVGQLLLTGPIMLGLANVYIRLTKENSNPEIEDLFSGFNQFGQSLVLYLLIALFTFLWSLLFIIPGIIKALAYSQAFYILGEHPEMSATEALDESKRMMDGHKMDLFILGLSFIGWGLLGIITCGLAYIYVSPYMSATYLNFYHKIK